jgi:EAL domain-containing protein (putative c-di-GMP-specific phosphodiesterase class I)
MADFQINIVKLDMALIRNIDRDITRQHIIRNCINLFKDLDITSLGEGAETKQEMVWLQGAGVELMQSYLFAQPGFECLPTMDFAGFKV